MLAMAETKSVKKSPKLTNTGKAKWTRDDTELSILALPTAVWFALFVYLPMFGIIIAFKDYCLMLRNGEQLLPGKEPREYSSAIEAPVAQRRAEGFQQAYRPRRDPYTFSNGYSARHL